MIWEIAEGAAEFGIETEVFTLSADASRDPIRVGHHVVHQARQDLYIASTGLSLSAFSRFARLAETVDVVHYHFPWPMMDLLHLAARPQKPTVITYHSDVVRQAVLGRLYRPLMLRFLASVDRIVATSPNYLLSSPVLQRFRDKTGSIPIGLGPRQQPDPVRLARWRKRLGKRFFLFVGVLRYYKGIADLIEATRLSGLPVVVLGEGEMRGELEAAGLRNLTLLGALGDADKEALLSLCTAFLFPSDVRSEAFGVALAEAARAGKPMISCEIGTGTSYVNVGGRTGFVVPPNRPDRIAAAMRQLWEDPGLAERMGRAAAERFVSHLTARQMARSYAKLYESLGPDAASSTAA